VADRRYGTPPPPTSTTVSGEDWFGRDLTGEEHTRVAFLDIDLEEATGTGPVFTECTFAGVRFNGAVLADAAFVNCTFTRCSFFDATFTRCKLVGSMFDRCAHDLMKVSGGDWSFVGLPGADLRRASFEGVRMREVDLVGARCEGAALVRCDLSASWFHQTQLGRCDLRGSDLTGLEPFPVDITGAIITYDQAVTVAAALGFDVRAE
jgi:uncharacterized protein YjbI with pentapeptide repeats